MMGALDARVKRALQQLEQQAAMWREEPAYRVALLNRPLRPLRVRQFHSFGAHSFVDRPNWLYGTHKIEIGSRCMFMRGAWLAVEKAAWDSDEPALRIGNDTGARPGVTISAASQIVIEEDVICGAYVSIVDSNHTWDAGTPNTLYNPSAAEPIRVGRGSWLGDKVTVVAGADIGEQCAIGSNAVVRGTIPDYSIAVGIPARVVGSTRG